MVNNLHEKRKDMDGQRRMVRIERLLPEKQKVTGLYWYGQLVWTPALCA